MFLGTIVRALGIVLVSSHLFGVRIVHRLFCWIPYSVRNVLKKNLELFSINSIGWGTISADSLGSIFKNSSLGTLHCLGQFSLI